MFNVQHNCDSSDDVHCTLSSEDNSVDTSSISSAHDTSTIDANITIKREYVIKGDNVAEEGLYTLACSVGSESSTYSTVIPVTSGKLDVKKSFK